MLVVKYFIGVVLMWTLSIQQLLSGQETVHEVYLEHPGFESSEKMQKVLIQIKDAFGRAEGYFMDVESVVCGDTYCRVDTIRIHWNILGFYSDIEIPQGVALEKREGEHFDAADYQKLNAILSKKDCGLRDVYKGSLVGSETTEGVDAISGPTILLHTDDYVEGAVWTCYTLWHWVHGEVVPIIRNLTGDDLDAGALLAYLKSQDQLDKEFALEQLTMRQPYTESMRKAVMEQVSTMNLQLLRLTLSYLEKFTPHVLATSLIDILAEVGHRKRQYVLNWTLRNNVYLQKEFYKMLIPLVRDWEDYPSIDQALKLLENANEISSASISNLTVLLDSDKFIISRRAYWFFVRQKMSAEDGRKLKSFYLKHKDAL